MGFPVMITTAGRRGSPGRCRCSTLYDHCGRVLQRVLETGCKTRCVLWRRCWSVGFRRVGAGGRPCDADLPQVLRDLLVAQPVDEHDVEAHVALTQRLERRVFLRVVPGPQLLVGGELYDSGAEVRAKVALDHLHVMLQPGAVE